MGATLGPVLNARWMPAGVFAERYLYMPLAGFCWLVAWASVQAWRAASAAEKTPPTRWHLVLRTAVPAAVAALALFYGVKTFARNKEWKSEDSIYRLTLAAQPDAQLIRTNLGVVLWSAGDRGGAEREWLLAAAGPHTAYASTLNDLGLARTVENRYAEAEAFFWGALAIGIRNSDSHKNLALVYPGARGRMAEAEGQVPRSRAAGPDQRGAAQLLWPLSLLGWRPTAGRRRGYLRAISPCR